MSFSQNDFTGLVKAINDQYRFALANYYLGPKAITIHFESANRLIDVIEDCTATSNEWDWDMEWFDYVDSHFNPMQLALCNQLPDDGRKWKW